MAAGKRAAGQGTLSTRTDRAGQVTWYGKWRVDGRQIKRRLGPVKTKRQPLGLTARQAEAALREAITTLTAGELERLKAAKARTAPTIAGILDAYLAEHTDLKAATTVHDYRRVCANWLTPHFGDRPVDRITADHVRALRDLMARTRHRDHGQPDGIGLRPKSIRNHLTLLSTLLAYAVHRGWAPVNVAANVKRPGDQADEDRIRFLEVHEVNDLVAHARPGDYQQLDAALYLTAALTGLRLGELRALRWGALDVTRSTVHVERGWTRGVESSTKSRRVRSVPLAPPVAAALADLRDASPWDRDDDLVFAHPHEGRPLPGTPLNARYRAARDAAGLPPVTFHELRHTFGTMLARAGEPVTAIQEWMGHSDLKVTMRYMHYAPKHDQAARIAAAFAVADPRVAAPAVVPRVPAPPDPRAPDSTSRHLTRRS